MLWILIALIVFLVCLLWAAATIFEELKTKAESNSKWTVPISNWVAFAAFCFLIDAMYFSGSISIQGWFYQILYLIVLTAIAKFFTYYFLIPSIWFIIYAIGTSVAVGVIYFVYKLIDSSGGFG